MVQNRLGNSDSATQEPNTVKNPFEIQPPPKDFNPLLASNKDLLEHGFPPRPNKDTHPLYFAKWERILSKPIHFVTPTLIRMNRARSSPSRAGHANSSNHNWSGALLENPPAGEKFDSASASWTVPTAYPPESAWNGKTYNDGYWQACCTLIGEGFLSNSCTVRSLAPFTEVTVKSGVIKQDAWAWYEWIPNGWTKIDKFAVTPGDTVDFTVYLPSSSLSHAVVWPINRTTSTSPGPIGFDEPGPSANLKGLTVEWIMEDATENLSTGQLFQFAACGTAFFFDCAAATAQSGNFNLSSNDTLNLSPNPPTILSTAQIISPTVLMTSSPDGTVMSTQ